MLPSEVVETSFVRCICSVVNGDDYLHKGFVWQAGKGKTLKREKLIPKQVVATINTGLLEKLGMKQAPNPLPALFDLSLKSRPQERWKDFPGYEGIYRISNHGRVKSLKKVSEGRHQQWYPERIKQLTVEAKMNESGKIKTGPALVTLCKDYKKKTTYVARWVYFLFVRQFDMSDSKMRVYYKDGDNLNINYRNLALRNAISSVSFP